MEQRIPTTYLMELTDVEKNTKMFELLNEYVQLSEVRHLKGIYYSEYYMRDLPNLTEEQTESYKEIFSELLSIAVYRLGEVISNFRQQIKSIVYCNDKVVISYSFKERGKPYVFDLICCEDGKIVYNPDFNGVQCSFFSWEQYNGLKKDGKIPEELHDIVFAVYATWGYTIERIKPKSYVLALKGLTVKNYREFLRKGEKCVDIDSFR